MAFRVTLLLLFTLLGLQLFGSFVYASTLWGDSKTCVLQATGGDDTDQIEAAVSKCGKGGHIVFPEGQVFNVHRKMLWRLEDSHVDLHGYLNFPPNITYWFDHANTFQLFLQSQHTWWIISGNNFVIDAHNTGGIQGNGQPWWSYFNATGHDGDGRPIAMTLQNVTHSSVKNFRVESPPFWSNMIEHGYHVTYDGMYVNATNTDPMGKGRNIVPNTDGIDTYRSDHITLKNWVIQQGDDCMAFKGNSTNIVARNISCYGGTGIAFGSLGQYVGIPDIIDNVLIEDSKLVRIDHDVQPAMSNGVYFKTWTGSPVGTPPTGGGGGSGYVSNVVVRNVQMEGPDWPIALTQTSHGGGATVGNFTDSTIAFSNLTFINVSGTASALHYPALVDILCTAAAPCPNIEFEDWNVQTVNDTTGTFICQNVLSIEGLPGPCTATGH